MDKPEKFEEEFAKRFDYLPVRLKRFENFLANVKEFAQYLGANQYYSDALNKRVLLLNIEVDGLLMDFEELLVRQAGFQEEFQKAALAKRKPRVNAKEFEAFKADEKGFEKKAAELKKAASEVINRIKDEYKTKNC